MLGAMREGSKNIFVKSFLGLLVVSFIVWGIGDVFRGDSKNTLAKIGNEEIGYNEFSNALQREIARFQQILGKSITPEQMEQLDIKKGVLNQLVDNKIVRLRVAELNLKVGDNAAKEQLTSNRMFFDESGKFSPENFRNILRSNGLNENDYISALKQDTAVRMLISTLFITPESLDIRSKALYRHRNEKRVADLVFIPSDYVKSVDEPSETDLVQYYQENTEQFTVPESREVSYLVYGFNDVKKSMEISDEALKAEYNANILSFTEPEKRDVSQYLFNNEDEAKAAFAEISSGKKTSYEDKKIPLGEVSQDGLPDEVREPVFKLKVGEFSEPVKSALGWHIFVVNKTIEPKVKPFEDVSKELEDYLKESKAAEIFDSSINNIEDDLAAGLALEDLAKKFDLVVNKIPYIDENAQGENAKPLSNIPEPEVVRELSFSLEQGENSPMRLLSDNSTYLVLRVDGITQKRVKALDEVKGTAVGLWKDVQKQMKLREIAKDVAEKMKNGEDLKKLAKSMRLKFKEDEKIKRPSQDSFLDDDKPVPAALDAEIFNIEEGDSTYYYKSSKGEYVIGRLKSVRDAQFDKVRLKSLEDSLKKDFTDDILRQYNIFLRKEYPVTINETLFNSLNL